MIILGIETSCDETAVSIVEATGDLKSLNFELLGNVVHSQVDIHKEFGGVVPHLAKREHQKNLPIILDIVLKQAFNLDLESYVKKPEHKIDLIAVTVGPGLEPALWVGINFAENLSKRLHIPVIGTNHMEGHIASVLLPKTKEIQILNKKIEFPIIALLVSGGHTELIHLKNWLEKEKIGETKDDAVGEAFDKVARMLSLPYPGGPEISKLAQEARAQNLKLEIKFPRPMIGSKDFDFSFSGLKTAVLYYIRSLDEINEQKKKEIAREFEDAVIETLIAKTKKAIEKYDPKTLITGGGVIANNLLRQKINELKEEHTNLEILISEKNLATDNAVMIAMAGYIKFLTKKNELPLEANGNLSI